VVASYTNVTSAVRPFSSEEYGGYECSGQVYPDIICDFSGNSCKSIEVFATNFITQDAWLYNVTSAYGNLGYGPDSNMWAGYIDYLTNTANYSIAVAKEDALYRSNITLGGYADMTNYTNAASLSLSTYSPGVYLVQSFGFGTVYSRNGAPVNQYFSNFTAVNASVIFQTNFRGLGLPAAQFEEFSVLLSNITNNQSDCATTVGGTCILPNACE